MPSQGKIRGSIPLGATKLENTEFLLRVFVLQKLFGELNGLAVATTSLFFNFSCNQTVATYCLQPRRDSVAEQFPLGLPLEKARSLPSPYKGFFREGCPF